MTGIDRALEALQPLWSLSMCVGATSHIFVGLLAGSGESSRGVKQGRKVVLGIRANHGRLDGSRTGHRILWRPHEPLRTST